MTLGTSTHGSLREYKKSRTASSIYDAALELYGERPYDRVTVDDICERARVGRATFFRTYGSKAGLLAEFNRRVAAQARESLESTSEPEAAARLQLVAGNVADAWVNSSPGVTSLAVEMLASGIAGQILTAGVASQEPNIHDSLFELTAEILREGQEAGQLDTRTVPISVLSFMVVASLATCVADWLLASRQCPLETTLGDTLTVLLDGLRA